MRTRPAKWRAALRAPLDRQRQGQSARQRSEGTRLADEIGRACIDAGGEGREARKPPKSEGLDEKRIEFEQINKSPRAENLS